MKTLDVAPFLTPWTEPPEMDSGAPCPALYSDEVGLRCAYYLSPRVAQDDAVAVLKFEIVLQHRFGYPNDEALAGHPLSGLGLRPYNFYTVENSRWRTEIENQNSAHHLSRPGIYAKFHHWLITFHDETLEVLAQRASVIGRSLLPPNKAVLELNDPTE
jgi:hypothetical protein